MRFEKDLATRGKGKHVMSVIENYASNRTALEKPETLAEALKSNLASSD